MDFPYTLPDILAHTGESVSRFQSAALRLHSRSFFQSPAADKWSPAQHVQHLATALKTSTAAYVLPLWLVKWVGGSPQHPSLTYQQLVARYQMALQEGGKASGRYIPRAIPEETGRDRVMARFERAAADYQKALGAVLPEEKLDQYQVAHPLLKKITLRELAFFNSYHILHHLPGLDPQEGRH